MSTHQFTPGPWFADADGYVYGGMDSLIVTDPSCANPEFSSAEIEANARLIAAAPELFGVCERLASWEDCPERLSQTIASELIRQARLTLAKATSQ